MERRPPTRRICKAGGYTRDRRGCLTCRRRKKRCTLDGPRCDQCVRLNLQCVWENQREFASPTASPEPLLFETEPVIADAEEETHTSPEPSRPVMKLTLHQPSYGPLSSGRSGSSHVSTHRQMAIRYYIQDFARILSTTEENNGFLSVLLPMAMGSEPLMDTLIAWSTSHLALTKEALTVKALEDRSTALRSFTTGLQNLGPEIILAICLTLTSMEAILGSTEDWHHHLDAAANIIKSTLHERSPGVLASSLDRSAEGRWLLRNFAYHDILASISLDREMLIPDLDWQGQTDHNMVDTYLGLASAPMALLGQVNVLSHKLACAEKEIESLGPPSLAEVRSSLSNIENEFLEWRPESTKGQALAAMAESYRSASLIHLYRIARYYRLAPLPQLETKIAHQVDVVMRCIAQMPVGCLPECTILFPMFIAGGETDDEQHQKAIQTRLDIIAQERHFANASTALDVLKEVWHVRSRTIPLDATRPYDWNEVLKRRKWNLALS